MKQNILIKFLIFLFAGILIISCEPKDSVSSDLVQEWKSNPETTENTSSESVDPDTTATPSKKKTPKKSETDASSDPTDTRQIVTPPKEKTLEKSETDASSDPTDTRQIVTPPKEKTLENSEAHGTSSSTDNKETATQKEPKVTEDSKKHEPNPNDKLVGLGESSKEADKPNNPQEPNAEEPPKRKPNPNVKLVGLGESFKEADKPNNPPPNNNAKIDETTDCNKSDAEYGKKLSNVLIELSKKPRNEDLMKEAKTMFSNNQLPDAIFDKEEKKEYSVISFIERLKKEGSTQIDVKKITIDEKKCKILRVEVNTSTIQSTD